MLSYKVESSPRTSGWLSAGAVACVLASTIVPLANDDKPSQPLMKKGYKSSSVAPTFDQVSSALSGEFNSSPPDVLQAALMGMYETLLKSQKDLEPDLKKILDDNRWELYERW